MRNAILRHRQRHSVRVFVTKHCERIKETEMFFLRAFFGNLDRDRWTSADRDGVNARKTRDTHTKTAVIRHHIDERLLRGFVSETRADFFVHFIKHARKQLRNKRRVAIGITNDEVLELDALPTRELFREREREGCALIIWIESCCGAQIFDGSRFTAILHGEQAKFCTRKRPRRFTKCCGFERFARFCILTIEHELSTNKHECGGA